MGENKEERKIKSINWTPFCSWFWPFNEGYGCMHEWIKVQYDDGEIETIDQEEGMNGVKLVQFCYKHNYPVPDHFKYIVSVGKELVEYCQEHPDTALFEHFEFLKEAEQAEQEKADATKEGKRKLEESEPKPEKKQKTSVDEE